MGELAKDYVRIGAWHGGLGDSLQFSTLPEQFYKQQGRETFVADGCTFRNEEIYDLVWGCNPYVRGVQEGPRNAGDIPEHDLWNTFNLGVGFCFVVSADARESVLQICREEGFEAWLMGKVEDFTANQENKRIVGLPFN